MRKNKMMRLASVLLVAVLLTTSVISGTYAKYVTSAEAEDSARVAKWGVELKVENGLFNTEYQTHESGHAFELSVKAEDDKNVIAPGTNSGDDGKDFTFRISGQPEVATKITIEVLDSTDVFLKAADGKYIDWTKAPYDKKFNLASKYNPVIWALIVSDNGAAEETIKSGTLAEVVEAVNTYVNAAEYGPNEKLDAVFTLKWGWAFEQGQNEADTLLGNIIANQTKYATEAGLVEGADYSVNTSINFKITVSQVD